jgi:hypothetical protein
MYVEHKGWTRKAFGQRIGPAHFNNLTPWPLRTSSSVNMSRALQISGVFAHHNTRGIIFAYLCGADLSEIEISQQRSPVTLPQTRLQGC